METQTNVGPMMSLGKCRGTKDHRIGQSMGFEMVSKTFAPFLSF